MLKIRTPISQFHNAKHIVAEPNSLIALKGLQCVKVAIIISKSISLDESKIEYIKNNISQHELIFIVRSWDSEPEIDSMKKSLNELYSFSPDCIIAIGGGSVIDGAKILWTFYEHPELANLNSLKPFKVPKLRGKSKFVAVPTTIGTGSEVSSSAILFDKTSGTKIPIVTNDYLPDLVILDAKLVLGIPKNIMVSTIIDACSHSIEGFVSKIDNHLMEHFSFLALNIIFKYSEQLIKNPNDEKLISNLQYASMIAGWVQNHCIIGSCHALSHQLGNFGISHGVANSIFLPETIKFNSKNSKLTKEKYESIADFCGISNGINGMLSKIEKIISMGEFQVKLSEYNINNEDFIKIAEHALLDPGSTYNPISLSKSNYIQILKKVL